MPIVSDTVKIWYQDLNIGDSSEAEDQFGYSVATGDFNNDTYDDLAVGVPNEDYDVDNINIGAVSVLYSSSGGFIDKETGDDLYQQWNNKEGDMFGLSLASGDFDNDGCDDLAVGVPYKDINHKYDSGAISVITGSLDVGLKQENQTLFLLKDLDIVGKSKAFDLFGSSVAAGDFNNDGYDDLAVGVKCEDLNGKDAGGVNVLYGSPDGLKAKYSFVQGVRDGNKEFDYKGHSLAAGDFNNDSYDDLAVGCLC